MKQRLNRGEWIKYEFFSLRNWWISITFGTFELMVTNWPKVKVEEKKYATYCYSNDDLD